MDIDNYVLHATKEEVRIRLRGKFNFHSRKAFNNACLKALDHREGRIIALDMADIEYLDSAALGMLLLFRDKAIQAGKDIVLRRARGEVLEILLVANFDRLFHIEEPGFPCRQDVGTRYRMNDKSGPETSPAW